MSTGFDAFSLQPITLSMLGQLLTCWTVSTRRVNSTSLQQCWLGLQDKLDTPGHWLLG